MNWVEQKIRDDRTAEASLLPLWSGLRDAIGNAVDHFCQFVHDPRVASKDCKARGKYCIRIERGELCLEVFLVPTERVVKYAGFGKDEIPICRYRLNTDRKALEFFRDANDGEAVVISSEEIAKAALEEFLFEPYPQIITSRL
jgi:hypothetical protein